MEEVDVEDVLEDLNVKGRRYCDRLHLKNVDVGHEKMKGFEELNNVIKETNEILNSIKSNLKDERAVLSLSEALERSCLTKEKIEKSVRDLNEPLQQIYTDTIKQVSEDLYELNLN